MPKGVEHAKELAMVEANAKVHSSVMPKGVEHTPAGSIVQKSGSPFIRDAERR